MEITEAQYERIEECLPRQRGNVKMSNLNVLNAILHVAEQGCQWRGLPKRFGRWHTVYTRMNRWRKGGGLARVFERRQRAPIVRIKLEAVSLDRTISTVHPEGTGALKKRPAGQRPKSRWMEHQDSSGCRECLLRLEFRVVTRPGGCRAGGAPPAAQLESRAAGMCAPHGSRLRRR